MSQSVRAEERRDSTHRLVLRNTLMLVAAQVFGMPLSIVLNAMMARYLGPEDFGYIYLASTFASFGFLLVAWGQAGTLPAMVARRPSDAGLLIATGFVWRLVTAFVVYGLIAAGCLVLGYGATFQKALALVSIGSLLATMMSLVLDAIRGFERTDITAFGTFGWQVMTAVFVIPTLLAGGHLNAVLVAQDVAVGISLVFVCRALRLIKTRNFSFDRETLKRLVIEGLPFLSLNVTMALQPNIDGIFLSKLAPVESVGWYAAARKLIGVLVYPASAMTTALYPTLARLHAENAEAFRSTVRSAVRATTVIVVPVALGCALYADIGIRIFSRQSFGPAESDLKILSLFLFACYFSMVLGNALAAAGRPRGWAVAQFACVVISAVADPILVPWFQARYGNGGLGICVSSVASELLMVASAIWLSPRGIFDRSLIRPFVQTAAAGGAMAIVARLLSGLSSFLAAPIAVAAYVGCLWAVGGLGKEQLRILRGMFKK
jgi:O-antigen/teichoic acid export membrane protein